jgi:hypothetical protein
MVVSGGLAITRAAPMMRGLAHLGYPPYFANLLEVGKIAGICILLLPGLGRLKEWAYVGFAIPVISASYSHFSSRDGVMALDPLVTLAALVVSYRARPESRRSAGSAAERRRREAAGQEGQLIETVVSTTL